jgi:hypothetical protein
MNLKEYCQILILILFLVFFPVFRKPYGIVLLIQTEEI